MGNTLTLMDSTLGDSFDAETMRLTLEAMFNGTFFYGQQKEDGTADKDSGGILVKINTKTGETKLLLSESLNGVGPLFRNAVSYKGKLYFCGSVRTNGGKSGLPSVYEIDPKTDEWKVVYQGLSSVDDYRDAYKQGISTGIRGMCVHDGQLVISNVGKAGNEFVATILTSSDPSKGQASFTEIANSKTLFGYPAIRYQDSIYGGAIWDMVSYNGHLYATICTGTPENAPDDNSMQSFAMVRGDKNADGSYSWTPIVGDKDATDPKCRAKYCFGIDPARTRSGAANLIVYNDYLYIGEYNDEEIALERILFNKSNTEEGGVTIDGHDMRDIDLRSYRKHLAVVPQTSILFSGTIRDNITYGIDDFDEESLNKVVDAANLRDLIDSLPDGLDTVVGEHGGKLSGGQRQRVSIARALMRNPEVIVLDEATSALDSISEKLIQEALNNLTKDRTTFIVAHRLSTIKGADRIAVIADGHCVEYGTYDELMELKGEFYQMKSIQS